MPKVDPETSSQGLLARYAKVNDVIRGAVVHLNRRSALKLLAAPALPGSLPAFPSGASAEPYPAKPIRIIVPYPAGGPYDGIPRIIAQWISAQLGWSIVMDNRTGATGVIGLMAAKQAAADGHTLVVVTTSTHGSMPALKRNLAYDAVSVYSASKAALRSMARTLARELLPRKIRVNAVSPGPIDTGKLEKELPAEVAAQMKAEFTASNPMLRYGRPDEFARAAAFMAFDATFTTGADTSDYLLTFVRTNTQVPAIKGMSVLLLPRTTPGLTIRPLRKIAGQAVHTCEIFFDDARVPGSPPYIVRCSRRISRNRSTDLVPAANCPSLTGRLRSTNPNRPSLESK